MLRSRITRFFFTYQIAEIVFDLVFEILRQIPPLCVTAEIIGVIFLAHSLRLPLQRNESFEAYKGRRDTRNEKDHNNIHDDGLDDGRYSDVRGLRRRTDAIQNATSLYDDDIQEAEFLLASS